MSANKTYQNFVEKLGGTHAENFIGDSGMMFWNPETGELRLGDGVTAGGVSLFKALASDFGISADGGNTIINDFNVITYDGGNATSPYNIYEIVDGNTPNPPSIQLDPNEQYTFSNTLTVNAVKAGGTIGTSGQVLTSTGYNTFWATPASSISNNTTLSYSGANAAIVSDCSDATVSVINNGTFNVPNFSGMLIVNDHYDGGVALYIAGGGTGVLVSNTNSAFDSGLTMNNNGYDWTNSTNLTGPFTFTVIKTRSGS